MKHLPKKKGEDGSSETEGHKTEVKLYLNLLVVDPDEREKNSLREWKSENWLRVVA